MFAKQRPNIPYYCSHFCIASSFLKMFFWSSRRDLNPQHSAWRADALPLNYYCIWCPRLDSNQHYVVSKTTSSANWDTGAYQKQFYIILRIFNLCFIFFVYGTGNGIRTRMLFPALDFKSKMSRQFHHPSISKAVYSHT